MERFVSVRLWRHTMVALSFSYTYHKDEVKYKEQVLDHSHSTPHLDR